MYVMARIHFLMLLACAAFAVVPQTASSQTPSPMQEWQYPGGIVLEKVFEPELPRWNVVLGAAALEQPIYQGSHRYRAKAGPVIDIRYYDIAFLSSGDGLGVNLIRGDTYSAGVSLGYDLGRLESDDFARLHGLGNIDAAPAVKVFGSWVVSKKIPVVVRADVRRIMGSKGATGVLGDLDAFVPLPGSSKTLLMLAGPSVSFANRQYMERVFGVSSAQARASEYEPYSAHGGDSAVGLGFSATKFITPHWLLNTNLSVQWLLGSARDSPITQTKVQSLIEISSGYRW
jgi:outer membrane scaffolding protein for murein synthesis (MipA/OmpV family)